tara:strand:- start:737 stop:1285 length:549 start_codon:yes stop_codon:yes gene_type:complete
MRLSSLFLLLAFLFQFPSHVSADTERIATPCDRGVCFHWWPKVQVPSGWSHDRDNSLYFNFNALAREGEAFTNAETVMYANAIYRPRVPTAKTLDELIAQDQKRFRSEIPDIEIVSDGLLKTLDGKTARTWRLAPKSKGQWERVAYFEEGEYYMVFVISSRAKSGLEKNMSSFEALVANYKE